MKREQPSFGPASAWPAKIASPEGDHYGSSKRYTPNVILGHKVDFAKCSCIILLILLLSSVPLMAEEGSGPTDQSPQNGQVSPRVEPQTPEEAVVWPPPFKPSEEIGADSQISFPTDI